MASSSPGRARRRYPKKHADFLKQARPLYQQMLEAQGGHCALCPRVPNPKRRLDTDHNHSTMELRGLLCSMCNRAVRDWMTPEWAENLALYLRSDPWDLP